MSDIGQSLFDELDNHATEYISELDKNISEKGDQHNTLSEDIKASSDGLKYHVSSGNTEHIEEKFPKKA